MSIGGWSEEQLARFIEDRADTRIPGLLATALVRAAAGTPLAVTAGTQVLTWAASTDSDTPSVTHGLGKVPALVVATCQNAPAFGQVFAANASSLGATAFNINGRVPVAYTGTISVGWVALG